MEFRYVPSVDVGWRRMGSGGMCKDYLADVPLRRMASDSFLPSLRETCVLCEPFGLPRIPG